MKKPYSRDDIDHGQGLNRESTPDGPSEEPEPTANSEGSLPEAPTTLLSRDGETTEIDWTDTNDPQSMDSLTRYEIIERLAEGGMGTVYRARDTQLLRDVAIKVLRREFIHNQTLVERFVAEARIMSYLQHPGVAPIYDCGLCDDDRPFHAMKLVHGDTLAKQIEDHRSGNENLGSLLNTFALVCQTLAYTHSQGIVHLDIKPSNVMVGQFGEVHLMDWGLAKFIGDQSSNPVGSSDIDEKMDHDSKVAIQGTPAYMSPEQARGKQVDTRTDVFGLGALLCEILTGRPPYQGKMTRKIFLRAARGNLRTSHDRLDQCRADPALVDLTKRCLNKYPDARPTSAQDVAKEMSKYRESALQRLESDMDRFFALSLDMFCIAGFNGVFQRVNQNFSRILGYEESELISRPFLDFVHPEDRDNTVDQMKVLFSGQPVVRFRNRYMTKHGTCRILEWTAKAIPDEQVIFAVARDVTE